MKTRTNKKGEVPSRKSNLPGTSPFNKAQVPRSNGTSTETRTNKKGEVVPGRKSARETSPFKNVKVPRSNGTSKNLANKKRRRTPELTKAREFSSFSFSKTDKLP